MGGVPVQAAGEQSPLKTYQNILVYAMVNLGDVILTTSAIAQAGVSCGADHDALAAHCARGDRA